MKRVRITLDPPAAARPPVYELLTRGADSLDEVHIVNWNVATPPAAFLLRLAGDYERFTTELDERGEELPEFEWELLGLETTRVTATSPARSARRRGRCSSTSRATAS